MDKPPIQRKQPIEDHSLKQEGVDKLLANSQGGLVKVVTDAVNTRPGNLNKVVFKHGKAEGTGVLTRNNKGEVFVVTDARIAVPNFQADQTSFPPQITIYDSNGKRHYAGVAKIDGVHNIVALKIDGALPENLKTLPLGQSKDLKLGQSVLSCSFPNNSSNLYSHLGNFEEHSNEWNWRKIRCSSNGLEQNIGQLQRYEQTDANSFNRLKSRLDSPLLKTTASAVDGNDNGILLGLSGKVLGVVVHADSAKTYAVPVEFVSQLINSPSQPLNYYYRHPFGLPFRIPYGEDRYVPTDQTKKILDQVVKSRLIDGDY